MATVSHRLDDVTLTIGLAGRVDSACAKEVEDEVEQPGVTFKSRKLFRVMIKFVAPVFVVAILIGYVLMTVGAISL